jgi:hypothetical protein
MSQMSAAFGAGNFSPSSVGINRSFYSPFYFVVETWPAAMGIKLVC